MSDQQRLSFKTRVLTLVVVLSHSLGNSTLNWGMKHAVEFSFSPLAILRVIFSPGVGLGIVLLMLWMLSRMALLSWADLSYVLPVTALGYVLTALIGKYFFGEQISPTRWVGTLLIVAGIVLVGLTQPTTTSRAGQEQLNTVESLS